VEQAIGGGRGNAGSGKRGDAKKPSYWKKKRYFGKYGFKKKGARQETNPVNLSYFEEKGDALLAAKRITAEGEVYIIDIAQLGFNKVLGYGKPSRKYKITAPAFSAQAKEKIEAAGGEAITTGKEAPEKPAEAAPVATAAEGSKEEK